MFFRCYQAALTRDVRYFKSQYQVIQCFLLLCFRQFLYCWRYLSLINVSWRDTVWECVRNVLEIQMHCRNLWIYNSLENWSIADKFTQIYLTEWVATPKLVRLMFIVSTIKFTVEGRPSIDNLRYIADGYRGFKAMMI